MEEPFYLGIDLDNENAVASFFQLNKKEPETISIVPGSEVFQIPLLLTKKKGLGQWFIGEEAKKLSASQGEDGVRHFLDKAIRQEMVFVEAEKYQAKELLLLYLKKIMLLAGGIGHTLKPDKLVVVLETVSKEAAELFTELAPRLGLSAEQLLLIDRKKSFYYFAYCQKEELVLHDMYLFDYRNSQIHCCHMKKNMRTKPLLVTIAEEVYEMEERDKDAEFLRILQKCFQGNIISSVYLTGDGFDGGWMKQSVAFLCKGRRAFVGKNLYSKGACYAAAVCDRKMDWNYVYMGENEMKVNVCLKLFHKGNLEFYTLISAGENWYETEGECEVLLSGTPELDFWLQLPDSREAKIERVTLSELPKRPDKTTRLRITAKPLSDTKVQIQMVDMGFGELFPSSEKVWEYQMSLQALEK